jgi:hypothetical protein
MLRFQQRVHLLIASILIVQGDEFRMLDKLRRVTGNYRDHDLPGAELHVAPTTAYPISESVATLPEMFTS